jgi:hypothetical protein
MFDTLTIMPTADQTHASALHGGALLQARRLELDALIAQLEALANGHDDTRVEAAGNMAAGAVDRDALVDAVQAGYEGAGGAI